jgi:hypothetical protein
MLGAWTYLGMGCLLICVTTLAVLSARLRAVKAECRRERKGREELEAYLRLDLRTSRSSDLKDLGDRICGAIAARSVFHRVAMLARDAGGELYLMGSRQMDETASAEILSWVVRNSSGDLEDETAWKNGIPMGSGSVVVFLGQETGRVLALPLQGEDGRLLGALVVCAESILEVSRRRAEEAIVGLEALGTRLTRALEAIEPVRRIRYVERLAGRAERIHARRPSLLMKATVSRSIH